MTKTTQMVIAFVIISLVVLSTGIIYSLDQINKINFTNQLMVKNLNRSNTMMGGNNMMGMMNMSGMIKDDQSFIENMIPHHQEAIDSSNQILNSTDDLELKTFVQNVISAQTKEINDMKAWYKTWFNKDYTSNLQYQNMMNGMKGKTGIELDQEYVHAMAMHHQAAIQMAIKIQTITKRPELLKLADNIITSQSKEKNILMNWMMSKYNNRFMMGR